jgi:hypothetical protein
VEILPAISDLGFQIIAAVVFLIPGLNTTWLIERLVGRTTPSGLERLLRAVSWSVLVYLLLSPWLLALASSHVSRALRPVDTIAFAAAALFAVPAVLGLLVAGARRSDRVRGWLGSWTSIHPAPTAWDYAFSTPKSRYVRVRLHGGQNVGGLFGAASFASSYPEPQDLFIEQAWRLDREGSFIEPIPFSEGILVRHETIEVVELLGVVGVSTDGE